MTPETVTAFFDGVIRMGKELGIPVLVAGGGFWSLIVFLKNPPWGYAKKSNKTKDD